MPLRMDMPPTLATAALVRLISQVLVVGAQPGEVDLALATTHVDSESAVRALNHGLRLRREMAGCEDGAEAEFAISGDAAGFAGIR